MTGMDVDIADPAHKADPHPFYARLRAETPVHRMTLPDGQVAWLVARYDDVVAAQKGRRLVKDKANALTPGRAAGQPWVPPFFPADGLVHRRQSVPPRRSVPSGAAGRFPRDGRRRPLRGPRRAGSMGRPRRIRRTSS